MELSRRSFLRYSVAAGGATALSGLIGSGVNLGPAIARAQELRIKGAKVTPSVCPYCSVGCGTLIHTINGQIVNIEGDPRSPHNEGTLCPKGAAIFQLHVNPNRPTQVLHRAAGAADWEVWDLERAMTRITELTNEPLWLTTPTGPSSNGASSSTGAHDRTRRSAALKMPLQFGPMSLTPLSRAAAKSSAW